MIHLLDGQNNEILATATKKDVLSNEHTQSLESYVESFEFTVKGDTKFAEKLAERNRIIIPSEDEGYIEFIVDKVVKKRKNGLKVRVLAMGSYLDLKKSEPIEPQTLTEYTGSMALGFVTNGTEWQPGRVESSNYRTFNIDNHVDVFTFLKRVANELDLELNFRIETRGGRVTGRYVDLLDGVGDWKGREVTFGKDLDTIKREEDFENVYTALKCIAPEDDDGNRLETIVEDKDALRRWGRPNPQTGELMHLMDVYEPQSDRQDMTLEELEQYGRTELNKRINSVVTYDIDVIDLENVPGMANKKIRFGDTIRIKDEKFNPSLYVEARVFEQRRDIFTKANKRIKLGDFTEFTEEEVQSVWQSLQAQINARVSQAELVEYTYDKITIDDKDEVVFKDGKTFAEAVGIEAKEYAETQDELVKQHANTVAGQAENNAKTYAEDRSAEALQQALAKSVAQEVYDNKMQEIADDLSEKAGIAYVDGQLQVIDGRIDDVNAEVEKKADGSTVYTISEVDNMINNVVSITEYETDIDGIIQTLDSQSTQIGQNTEAIGFKADSSRVDAIEGTVEDHNAQFIVMDNRINSKVDSTYVRGAIDGIEIGGRNLLISYKLRSHSPYNTTPIFNDGVIETTMMTDRTPPSPNFTIRMNNVVLENKEYTLSGFMKVNGDPVTRSMYHRDRINTYQGLNKKFHVDDATGRFEIVEQYSGSSSWIIHLAMHFNQGDVITIENFKLEKGNKATDWTPAPEDTQAEIDSVYSYASSEIDQLAGRIDLKAESTYVDGVESRVTTAEQTIDAIDGRISMVVSEQGTINAEAIASEISLTSSAIDLISNNINLVGAVTVLSDITGDLGTITAGEIYGAYIEGATIKQQGTQNYIEINNDGIFIKDNEFHQPRISIETRDIEYAGGGYFPSLIRFEKNVGEYNFAIGTNGAGLGTGFVGFLEQGSSNRNFEIANPGGVLYFPSREARFTGDVEADESITVKKGVYLPNAIGFTVNDPEGLVLPNNNRISTHGEGLAIYGNRNNDNSPFKVRSHDNIGSYRNDFEIDGASGRIVSEPTVDNTTTNSANIHVFTSTGRFSRSTSARRYKILEEPIKNDVANKIMNLSPKNWYDKRSFEGYAEYLHRIETGKAVSSDLDLPELLRRTPGLVAEDIEEAGLGDFVQYSEPDEKGKRTVEGVMYDRLWTLLIPIVRDLRNEVDGIKRKLEESK